MSPAVGQSPSGAPSPPLVSVVIPAYNVAPYLGEALASVRAQTFRHYEIIVINDGSPDTQEMERVLASFGPEIVYVAQSNRGPSAARNTGVRMARGEFIAFLDGDDVWLPDCLHTLLGAFDADPALDLCYGDAELIGDSPFAGRSFMETVPSHGEVTVRALLTEECVVMTSCVLVRRQAVIDAGLFDEGLSRCEDFDLWVRLAHKGCRLAFRNEVIARHRMRSTSLAADLVRMFESQAAVYRKFLTTLDLPDSLVPILQGQARKASARADLERGKCRLIAGDYAGALDAFEERVAVGGTTPKLSAVIIALRLMPASLRRAYFIAQWVQSRYVRIRSRSAAQRK